jgi:surface protein
MQSLKKFYFGKSKYKPFISTWNTSNTSTGSSTATQVKLPLTSGGSYNFVVEWGDGTQNTITAWDQAQVTKTYSVAGTYQITIKGKCIGWVFNNTGDRNKILSIQQWGSFNSGNNGAVFFGCSNLNIDSVIDVLDVKNGNSILSNWFNACSNLTAINRVNEWDVSSVSTIAAMFTSTKFNGDIGSWNVSNIVSFADTFNGSWFNNGGSASINNWTLKSTGTIDFTRMFALNTRFNQPIGNWNTSRVNNCNQMFQGASLFNQNIGSWIVSNVTNFSNFMTGKTPATFSTANLDAIFNGWSTRPVLATRTITFGTAKYTAASSAGRAILTGAPNNWVITDGGI